MGLGRALWRRGSLAARLAVRDRALLRDYVRWFTEGRGASEPPERTPLPGALSFAAAVDLVGNRLGPCKPGPAYRDLRAWHVADEAYHGGGSRMGGDSSLGEIVYRVVRATRPDTVVETGVATGVTSAYALAALADNGEGELHSIDLPPTDMLERGTVGAAVPPALKERWIYHWGSARRLLPRVLADTGGCHVFVHDSDHSYEHLTWELRTAWGSLAPGGVIVCDDVDYHTGFVDVATEVGGDYVLVRQAEKAGTTGLLLTS